MKKIIIGLIVLTVSYSAFAKQSMRKCMLLPLTDTIGNALAFPVFQEVEKYLRQNDWCYYKSNSGILNILDSYRRNLDVALENKELLKIIAEKVGAGSLIKVKIDNHVKGVEVSIVVKGENGSDVYFREKTHLNSDDVKIISQTVINWLEVYEKTIPYDGQILGVLGDQFTIDIGKASGVHIGSEINILRPKRKRRHPLLREIVDWETEKIALAKIFHVSEFQAQGRVRQYESNKRADIDDWVLLTKTDTKAIDSKVKFDEVKEYEFGKLGNIGFNFEIGTGSASSLQSSGTTNKIGGMLLGISLESEIWATRKFWGGLDIKRKFGSYKEKEGSLQNSSNNMSMSAYKIKAGYKYLPLGFFYGPQVDGYVGYAKYTYGLDTSAADGFTEVSFKGILVGARGNIPVHKMARIFLELDFIVSPKYAEEAVVYNGADSASNYHLEFGGSYLYSPSMTIDGSVDFTSSKAKFKSPTRELSLSDTSLKVGTTFTF